MKNRLIAGFLLLSLICWAFPLQAKGQTAVTVSKPAQTNQQVYGPPHNPQSNIEPIPRTGSKPQTSKVLPSSLDSGRDYSGKTYTKEEVQDLIRHYSEEDGISPDLPLRIVNCESGFNQFSKNKSSTASGVFQWLNSSWKNQAPGRQGISVFDADANVQAAVWLIAHGQSSAWDASRGCWSGQK